MSLDSASPSVVLGQPILVEVIIENDSPAAWIVDWGGYLGRNVTLRVSNSAVQAPTEEITRKRSLLDQISIATVGGPVALENGEQLRQTLVLNSWYDFDEVGSYDVIIKVPVEYEQASIRDTLEVELVVEVTGADPEALAEACSELAETAIHGSVDSAFKAGEALSHVRDEVCLPYLACVLTERTFVKNVKNDVVTALAEMGSEAAISVLVARWEGLSLGVRATAVHEFRIRGRANQLEAALAAEGLSVTDERDGES